VLNLFTTFDEHRSQFPHPNTQLPEHRKNAITQYFCVCDKIVRSFFFLSVEIECEHIRLVQLNLFTTFDELERIVEGITATD
jgi:hypothetical protein